MISAVILTKNASKTIQRTIASLPFKEVIIVDNGSSDNTLEIAQSFPNVRVFSVPFTTFGALRNYGAALASFDWILAIDSDEVLSEELQKELLQISLSESALYEFTFKNYFKGKWIRSCGWYPDRHIRLYSRKFSKYSETELVHESLQTNITKVICCNNPILHYSYTSFSDFLTKMQRYSDLYAHMHYPKKKGSITGAFFRSLFTFFRSYVLKKGFIDGEYGLAIALYQSHTTFYKYAKLAEKYHDHSSSIS